MKNLSKKEKVDLKVELKSRKIILKKLDTAIKALEKPIVRYKADREKRKEQISEYRNEEELHEAYGWEFITEDEYYTLLDAMRNGIDAIDNELSAEEIAQDMLKGWRKIIISDIESITFELLPANKQQEILDKNYEIIQKRMKRIEQKKEAENEN